MKSNDQHKYVDLLDVFGNFRAMMGQVAAHQDDDHFRKLADQAGIDPQVRIPSPDEIFEQKLEKLNLLIRDWWQDYKANWRMFYP